MPRVAVAALLLLFACGCHPSARAPLEPIPLSDAIAIVNANTSRITVCLKATGSVRGRFTDDAGRQQPFDLHAAVQVLAPRYMYASFKSGLGTEEITLGSNPQKFWLYVKRDNETYRVGTYAALAGGVESPMPLRPDMLIEALGFNALPGTTLGTAGPVQRIVDQCQQLIFLSYTNQGQAVIHKEYWLDRHDPRLIRRILFRDGLGRVVMDSALDGYRPLPGGGPLLPRRVRVEWPLQDAVLDFRIRAWKSMPERGPGHPAFVAPHERGTPYRNMINLDTGAPLN